MRVIRGAFSRPPVIGVPAKNSSIRPLIITLIAGVLISLVLQRSWGAVACPGANAPQKAGAKCAKPATSPAKGAAKVTAAPPMAALPAAAPATSWKTVLEPLPAGGWAYISDGPAENPSAVYASSHNVLHNGNVVTAWIRWEFSHPQAEVYPLHYLSAVTREELDCDARSYRRSAVIYYTRNNLAEKGPSFTALNDNTNWKVAIPGTEPDAMLNWGCLPAASAHASAVSTKSPAVVKAAKAPPAASSAPAAASSAPAAGGTELHTTR